MLDLTIGSAEYEEENKQVATKALVRIIYFYWYGNYVNIYT
jgi:hypothetical protein